MSIQVSNLSDGETLTYQLALLIGEVTPPLSEATIHVRSLTNKHCLTWPIFAGYFKAVVPLEVGSNHIQLSFYDETLDLHLTYQVPPFIRFVRPVYIVAADDDGYFQGLESEDCSPDSAIRRIAFGAKLLQTFTAEKLSEHGLGRRNFVLETDLFPKRPVCHIFRSKLKIAEAYALSGADLWMHFAKELMSSKEFDKKEYCKWFAFISFTRYDPPQGIIPKTHSEVLKFTKGHTALGGGGLALFGTGNLHTWAGSLEDLIPRFTDARKIDRSKFMDDSAYRQTHWANYSTGLGAALHELGHTFDLAHTPTGVMARGFDDLYRVFTVHPMTASRNGSRDSSYLASPIPYSPRHSPVHRPKRSGSSSRSGSPKPCPLSRPRNLGGLVAALPSGLASLPAMIHIETAFKRLSSSSSQTFTVNNYDGSKTTKTIIKHRDGTETITEVTSYSTGEQIAKEIVRNESTGRARTTMSMSTSSDALSDIAQGKSGGSKTPGERYSSLADRHPTPGERQPVIAEGHLSSDDDEDLSASSESQPVKDDKESKLKESSRKILNHASVNNARMLTSNTNGVSRTATVLNDHSHSSMTYLSSSPHKQSAPNKPTDLMLPTTTTTARPASQDTHTTSTSTQPTEGGSQSNPVDTTASIQSKSTPPPSNPAQLPRSPSEEHPPSLLPFREVQYRDGGAHWYRASAVLLRYHKWFNPPHKKDQCKAPELVGNVIRTHLGIRVIELRSLPDSVVFHHWEFLHTYPPSSFRLKYTEVEELSRKAAEITIVAMDNNGNVMKKKIAVMSLKDGVSSSSPRVRPKVTS